LTKIKDLLIVHQIFPYYALEPGKTFDTGEILIPFSTDLAANCFHISTEFSAAQTGKKAERMGGIGN